MLVWKEKLNLGKGRYIEKEAQITDTQYLVLYQNKINEPKYQMYVEYQEENAQPKRFYLTSTSIKEAEKEAEEVIMKYFFNEAHDWLKRYNRFKEAVFNETASD